MKIKSQNVSLGMNFIFVHFVPDIDFAVRMQWSMIKVKGQGPTARRRQCCCVIGDKVYLFGGTR